MKRLFLSTVAAAAVMVGPAVAADMRAPVTKAPPMAAPAYSWTGCYLGVHGGGAWTQSDWLSVGGVNASPDGDGAVFGGHIGCNLQIQTFVFGVEGDYSWTSVEGTGPWSTPGFTASYDTEFLASVRGRLGVTFNQFLLYGTGGAAFANWKYRTTPCACTGFDNSDLGWVAGGGIEWAFTPSWTLRVEYLHYDFGSVTSPANGVDSVATSIDTTVDVVRAGITYRFGGPIVARY